MFKQNKKAPPKRNVWANVVQEKILAAEAKKTKIDEEIRELKSTCNHTNDSGESTLVNEGYDYADQEYVNSCTVCGRV